MPIDIMPLTHQGIKALMVGKSWHQYESVLNITGQARPVPETETNQHHLAMVGLEGSTDSKPMGLGAVCCYIHIVLGRMSLELL